MRWHGVDPASVNLMGGLSAEEMLGRFRNGDADYLQVPYPFAGQLVDEGPGHIAVTLGTESGYVCYSSFAVTPTYLAENPDTVQRFVNGYARAQRWVAESEPEAVAERIAPVFPEYDRALLADGVRRYKGAGVWATDPMIGRNGFDRMRDALIAGGLVRGAHPYESIVRPEFAERAVAGLASICNLRFPSRWGCKSSGAFRCLCRLRAACSGQLHPMLSLQRAPASQQLARPGASGWFGGERRRARTHRVLRVCSGH